MTQTVLILGASGKIGRAAATAFARAGWEVRRYQRGSDMTRAALGAQVIVNGLNPPNYHNWAKLIPEITAQVIAAARASGATVIVPGNVYNFDTKTPGPWDETTPQRPTTRKGRIRVAMEEAYRASGVRTVILRAGSFIEPAGKDDTMAMLYLRSIAKGKVGQPGDSPTTLHAHAYLPDWAQAAVMLAERRETLAAFEDIPFPGHAFSAADLKAALERATGKPLAFARFPWGLMRLLSPVWELARELTEMRPLWNTSHELGRAKFDRLLPGFAETPLREVLLAGLAADVDPDKVMRTGGSAVGA